MKSEGGNGVEWAQTLESVEKHLRCTRDGRDSCHAVGLDAK